MRMQAKFGLYLATYVFGGFALVLLSGNGQLLLPWFVAFGVGSFFLFRCPSCRETVWRSRKSWFASTNIFFGKKCPHCQQPI